jgi:hypothetical protein
MKENTMKKAQPRQQGTLTAMGYGKFLQTTHGAAIKAAAAVNKALRATGAHNLSVAMPRIPGKKK